MLRATLATLVSLRIRLITGILDRYKMWKTVLRSNHQGHVATPVDLPSHNINENRRIWNTYDWSRGGEEWATEVKKSRGIDPQIWKETLINEMMLKYIRRGSTVLEIGMGAGRWSEYLQHIAGRLILCDISQKCIDICKKRFMNANNIEYHLIDQRLDFISDNSIDYIWSYDVFIHINPADIEKYILDFQRILKQGGCAIIHHSNVNSAEKNTRSKFLNVTVGFRSYMTATIFRDLVKKCGMHIVEQNHDLPHSPLDVVSVFIKP